MKGILLEGPELDAFGQMALDEALVASAAPDTVTLRFYRWPEQSFGSPWGRPFYGVTFGYFQSFKTVSEQVPAVKGPPPPIVRRLTGGGIVFHDGDITFSIVFPWNKLWPPGIIYKDLHRGIHLGLKAQNIPSRLWSPPNCKAPAVDQCFVQPSPIDLVHEDGQKFLGGALRRSKGTGLYQGSMRIERFSAPRENLEDAVKEGIALEWKLIFKKQAPPASVLEQAKKTRRDRYSTEDWNKRR